MRDVTNLPILWLVVTLLLIVYKNNKIPKSDHGWDAFIKSHTKFERILLFSRIEDDGTCSNIGKLPLRMIFFSEFFEYSHNNYNTGILEFWNEYSNIHQITNKSIYL